MRDARPEEEVFADLAELCASPGYAHALAFLSWRDNTIRPAGEEIGPEDIRRHYSGDQLIRNELSTLLGLVVKAPRDLGLPAPAVLQDYVEGTERLLRELHDALASVWREGLGEVSAQPLRDPFANARAIREPIFYGADAAYDFQYCDLAARKYGADADWLEANKGFRIEDAVALAQTLSRLLPQRMAAERARMRARHPDTWTFLPAFAFSEDEVLAEVADVGRARACAALQAFSYGPDERNDGFRSLNDFNETNERPILRLDDGTYLLLQSYSLLEAVYEAPFFWMAGDAAYASKASANRGHFAERFVADRLASVFGPERVFTNVDIYRGKNRFAEADVLVVYGDIAVVVQAKSKRLTLAARKGNDQALKADFKKAIQHSYDQAALCGEALSGSGFRVVGADGSEVRLPAKLKTIFPLCVLADHYPALALQVRQFLVERRDDALRPALVADVFAVDVLAEMLASPLQFLNYLFLHARFGPKLHLPNELTALGYHLEHNLWLDDEHDWVHLAEDFTATLDIAMMTRRAGWPGSATPKGTLTRFEGTPLGRIVAQLEAADDPAMVRLGLLVLQLGSQTAEPLNKGLKAFRKRIDRTDQGHDLSLVLEAGGLTVHVNDLSIQEALAKLEMHCRIKKYELKAPAWYGLLLSKSTGDVRRVILSEAPWRADGAMEQAIRLWQSKTPVPMERLARVGTKIGRNEACPCGSGRKYKRCCATI